MAERGSLPRTRKPRIRESDDAGVIAPNSTPVTSYCIIIRCNLSACFVSALRRVITNFLASCEKLTRKGFPGQVLKPWPLIGGSAEHQHDGQVWEEGQVGGPGAGWAWGRQRGQGKGRQARRGRCKVSGDTHSGGWQVQVAPESRDP